ncbi:MAG: FGGY-family carbohydrate kinase, partial [Candidatus Kryptoniota bacterium]
VAYGIRHNLEEMRLNKVDIHTLFAVGGGTKNSLWMHIVSDVLGESQTVRDTIGASYGDAFLAAIGTGIMKDRTSIKEWLSSGLVVEPDAANHLLYNHYFTLYKSMYVKSADILHELTKLAGIKHEL